MITQSKPKVLVSSPKSFSGVINPSRRITAEDEVYLRDYEIAAAVISWDKGVYRTPEQVKRVDITNIAFVEDIVWYQLYSNQAVPIDIESFRSHHLQIQQMELALTQQQQQSRLEKEESYQLAEPITDSTSQEPDCYAIGEYESGITHGHMDAAARMKLICTSPSCPYSAGYLLGYNEFIQAHQQQAQPEAKSTGWRVT